MTIEDGVAWTVSYRLETDNGRWIVNGTADPVLDGCVDVDPESSASSA